MGKRLKSQETIHMATLLSAQELIGEAAPNSQGSCSQAVLPFHSLRKAKVSEWPGNQGTKV